MVNRAIALGAYKVQFFGDCVSREAIEYAHENGIRCNYFYADDPAEARRFLEMGIDTVLTNDYLAVYNAVKDLIQ